MNEYNVRNLREHNLMKLTTRDIRGVSRITPTQRAHRNVHYLPVAEHGRIAGGKRFTADDVNASFLARIAALPGDIRVRFLYGTNDKETYSSIAFRINEYSWDEMRAMITEDDTEYEKLKKTGSDSPLHFPDSELTEDFPLRYIVWEKVG